MTGSVKEFRKSGQMSSFMMASGILDSRFLGEENHIGYLFFFLRERSKQNFTRGVTLITLGLEHNRFDFVEDTQMENQDSREL